MHVVVVRLSLVNFLRTVLWRPLLPIALKPDTRQVMGLWYLLFSAATIIDFDRRVFALFLEQITLGACMSGFNYLANDGFVFSSQSKYCLLVCFLEYI